MFVRVGFKHFTSFLKLLGFVAKTWVVIHPHPPPHSPPNFKESGELQGDG